MIHLDGGQLRDRQLDCVTMCAPIGLEGVAIPWEALFLAHYRAIRQLGRSVGAPGLAIIAVHAPSCRLMGRAWLAAPADDVASAIIGRHSEVDLLLEDPRVSLRHLAVVLSPPASWDAHAIAYEVLDLRTQDGFRDEHARRLEGVRVEGPALLSCGPYALFCLQTGDRTDWPELATDAWSMLPERVFLSERAAEPDRWRRGPYRSARAVDPSARSRSCITAIPAPLSPDEHLVAKGEDACGFLHVSSRAGRARLPVGPQAIARGVLLGRYSRCDASNLLRDESISRAHVLVKRVGSRVVAIDTASSDGTYAEGSDRPRRTVDLGTNTVVLGAERASVRWESAAS